MYTMQVPARVLVSIKPNATRTYLPLCHRVKIMNGTSAFEDDVRKSLRMLDLTEPLFLKLKRINASSMLLEARESGYLPWLKSLFSKNKETVTFPKYSGNYAEELFTGIHDAIIKITKKMQA